MSKKPESILQFDDVAWHSRTHLVDTIEHVDLVVGPGDCVMVRQEAASQEAVLFDLAEGLRRPHDGCVRFLGRDWRRLSAFESARQRGRIGRVFETMGWVSNLNVYENIVLSQRHHTARGEDELREETEALVLRAGFAGIPHCRPHLLRRDELRRAQWVRAFLGEPALVLLERPQQDVKDDGAAVLWELIEETRARGGAVVWLGPEAGVRPAGDISGIRRYVIRDARLMHDGEEE